MKCTLQKEEMKVSCKLSIAVISRTAQSMTRFLNAVVKSTNLDSSDFEILCSWNGGDSSSEIIVPEGLNFKLHEILPYNFAKNNNSISVKYSPGNGHRNFLPANPRHYRESLPGPLSHLSQQIP